MTLSKVMTWVAADRGCRLALVRGHEDVAKEWRVAAEEIHADICAQAVDARGVFTQHYDTDLLDASLLLLPLFRFLPPDDPASSPRSTPSPTSWPSPGSCGGTRRWSTTG